MPDVYVAMLFDIPSLSLTDLLPLSVSIESCMLLQQSSDKLFFFYVFMFKIFYRLYCIREEHVQQYTITKTM